jgi:HEAT repeats
MNSERLIIMLRRLRKFLRIHEVGSYVAKIDNLLESDKMPLESLRHKVFESLFSGSPMGNITGLAIMKMNGHRVEQETETNYELSALLDCVFEEVKYSVHAEEADRTIKHFLVYPKKHEEWEDELLSDDLESIFDVLNWITYYHSDWKWVQDWCLRFLEHPNPEIRANAVTCLADLAHLHLQLDAKKVIPQLQQLLDDPDVKNRSEDALREINAALGIFS